MRRVLLVGSALIALGCAGLSEGLVELSTGMDIETRPDGTVVITNPDGTRQIVSGDGKASLPDGFPLPAPPGSPAIESVVATEGGTGLMIVTWRLTDADDTAEILAFYEAWFAEQGQTVQRDEQDIMGLRTVAMVARADQGVHTVTYTDALGNRLLTVAIEPGS